MTLYSLKNQCSPDKISRIFCESNYCWNFCYPQISDNINWLFLVVIREAISTCNGQCLISVPSFCAIWLGQKHIFVLMFFILVRVQEICQQLPIVLYLTKNLGFKQWKDAESVRKSHFDMIIFYLKVWMPMLRRDYTVAAMHCSKRRWCNEVRGRHAPIVLHFMVGLLWQKNKHKLCLNFLKLCDFPE